MPRLHSLSRVLPGAILSFVMTACGSDPVGPHGPQTTVLTGSASDFEVCRDTTGRFASNSTSLSGLVGNLEIGDSLVFLAGECRTVLMFNSSALSVIPDTNMIDSIRFEFGITGYETSSPPTGEMHVAPIHRDGTMSDAFDASDLSSGLMNFTPGDGDFTFHVQALAGGVGTGGMIAYRLQMISPGSLDGTTHAWDVAMAEVAGAGGAKLTYFWTP